MRVYVCCTYLPLAKLVHTYIWLRASAVRMLIISYLYKYVTLRLSYPMRSSQEVKDPLKYTFPSRFKI